MRKDYFWGMHKRIPFMLMAALALSCSDGELQIESLDFDSVAIDQCGSVSVDTEIFFKINGDQALILDLGSPRLPEESGVQSFSVPSQVDIIYRIFDGSPNNAYFCSDIPPTSPRVNEEIEASEGTVTIITTPNADGIRLDHAITFEEITLINGAGERITDLTINDFGTVSTTPSSVLSR